MAGNIVKWWKHKILGGYKQFSVLQECTTDSEELIYPVRAPSSCSAPPDLLLVSDRETVQLKQSVNIIPTLKGHHNNHHHSHHHHQQQQQQKDNHSKKALINKNNTENPLLDGSELHGKAGTDERMRLEEFTCDVSVEGGKSSQPLQFSFTFYDLDGHHGKITKDDIAGIVYTIYESIGKSVVVPHCGSKTINVRLTVSPEGKTKPSGKLKKINTTSLGAGGGGGDGIMRGASAAATTRQQSRRQHRYRPRKLIKSDEEEDDAESDSEKELNKKNGVGSGGPSTSKATATADVNQKFCYSDEGRPSAQSSQQPSTSCKFQQLPTSENIYESVGNLKFNLKEARKDDSMLECKECVQSTLTAVQHQQHHQHQQFQQSKHILTRAKLLRRARKHKYQEKCFETRQRSLSVGNESSWKMRTAAAAAATRNAIEATTGDDDKPIARTTTTTTTTTTTDDIDGIQEPITSECWNNALKRNDLIDIIRASMEKNRLCFQSNGKPQRNGISPVRHRQRSRIISKIVNETDTTTYHQHHQSQQQQTSHHIPIYHQQMAINPALLAPHPKTNLCGYDSFLHATICTSSSANNSPHSAPPVPNHPQMTSAATTANAPPPNKTLVNNHSNNNIKQLQQHQHRMNKISRNTAGYHTQQNSPQFHSNLMGQQQKLNTSLLNSLNPQLSAEGKLVRTIDNVEKWLNEKEHLKSTSKYDESKFKKDEKNYDNLLYSKLNEKFLDVNGSQQAAPKKIMNNNNNNHHHHHQNISNKENNRRQHHYNHYQRHSRHSVANRNASAPISAADNNDTETTLIASSDRLTNISKFITMIPINIDDPIECENLIHPTSDDDTLPPTTPPPPTQVINEDGLKSGGGEDSASASNNGNNSTSSTVHRYVHEHIHHHYHHFENKDD